MSIGRQDIIPLDILACYAPPSIAVHFRKPNDSIDMIHKITLRIKPAHTSQSLFDELQKRHSKYIGPTVINQAQVPISSGQKIAGKSHQRTRKFR